MNDLILVTNWDKVERDDFYLSKDWKDAEEGDKKECRALAEQGKLYEAYIVKAMDYAIYYQMDADKVFINDDMDVLMYCESAVIGNDHDKRIKYEI